MLIKMIEWIPFGDWVNGIIRCDHGLIFVIFLIVLTV